MGGQGDGEAIEHGAWLDLPDEVGCVAILMVWRQSQKTALAWAASHGNAVAVRELLKAKASVDLRDNCGWTALAWAVTRLHLLTTYAPRGAQQLA